MGEDDAAEQMKVTQDVEYTYDLGRNVTQVKLTDDKGCVYTETRSYARGYQLTDFSEQHATGVTVVTLGSYTYDTNNNMTGTKSIDVKRGDANERLAYRAQWTFTFDRKNRVASHTNQETDLVRHLRWDGLGRVWQRWDYDSDGEEWSATLIRYVYDGALAQEHVVAGTEVEGAWQYTYMYLTRDYLRGTGVLRQREGQVDKSYTDRFLLTDSGTVSGRFTRGSTVSLEKAQRVVSGDRQARYFGEGAEPTGSPFTDVSNLGFASTYIESYGGTKSGDAQFFDALNQFGDRHYLPGLGRFLSRAGNNPYLEYKGEKEGRLLSWEFGGGSPEQGWGLHFPTGDIGLPEPNECCWAFYEGDQVLWELHGCPGPSLKQKREQGWYPFCCTEHSCLYMLTPILAPDCGPVTCGDEPQGHDCHESHCDWSFGFGGVCANLNIVNCHGLEPTIEKAFEYVCKQARWCACAVYGDDWFQIKYGEHASDGFWMGEWRGGTYRGVWGCLADICRGAPGAEITIKCEWCTGIPGMCSSTCCEWPACNKPREDVLGYILANAGSDTIHLCMEAHGNRLAKGVYFTLENTILHEMLHACGVGLLVDENDWLAACCIHAATGRMQYDDLLCEIR